MTGHAMRIDAVSFSHGGGRDYNEDAVGDCEAFGAVRLFVLADGAGGQGGGDVAAQTAVAAARAEFIGLPVFSPDTLRRCMEKADAAILAKQTEHPRLSRMASTFVALLVNYQRRQILIGNLGDSRCYVFRGDKVIAQSYDHSLVQRFVDAGLYPLEKLRQHPKRNVLYASLGANEEGISPFLTETPIELHTGDGVLLCSDGVWELLDDVDLCQLHAGSENAEVWRDRLVARVRDCMPAGHDNFSAIMLRCLAGNSEEDDPDVLRTVQPSIE
ncbi:MAG: PP2C family protein-serine/threonine phosphatase [Rhodoferax sp.]